MVAYEPTWESLEQHELPDWFDDAKLGIFIHWGAYSVPAWAPVTDDGEVSESGYAEWYVRGMYDEDSDVYDYHRSTYGEQVEYTDFLEQWSADGWDPERWATFFDEEVGARYVVLTAEHHDGIQLWDSDVTDWTTVERGPNRDIVGELGAAVRDRDMKFAGSFHGLLNFFDPDNPGLFGHPDVDDEGHPGPEYVEFMNEKLTELIDETRPDLLWLDGNWKADTEAYGTKETVAYYYEQAAEEWDKEVAVNDRLGAGEEQTHGDFYTPEYETFDERQEHKWEATRGLGGSFGYNRNEPEHHYLSVEELVHSFVDIVSKNGNLLINVGPRADGTIPAVQKERLRGLGEWLAVNGDAIYGTTYWERAADTVASSTDVRYTWKDGTLYATLFDWAIGEQTLFEDGPDVTPASVSLLTASGREPVDWQHADGTVTIDFDANPPSDHPGVAYTLTLQDVANSASSS
ncbi:alpha-L-fucosidase [Halomicrobium sp. LC1Hm]|uniref:alpha-L-fucosidase n=1 Tax=Halomicrobium sp. LC1Hm TaxID=2610902 RepID=UPI0012985718|nr:alpha-L-fucosidase [Halomicrobium sp. LC1Hm]QGA82230.1 Alpha-L-fucosidase [Halomicrobium sp. LC1Hm]